MSLQLDRYLALRADGATMMTAAARSGIGIDEARLTENAMARGEIDLPSAEDARATTHAIENPAPGMARQEGARTWRRRQSPMTGQPTSAR